MEEYTIHALKFLKSLLVSLILSIIGLISVLLIKDWTYITVYKRLVIFLTALFLCKAIYHLIKEIKQR